MNNSVVRSGALLFTRHTENYSESCKNSVGSFPNTFLNAPPFNIGNVVLSFFLCAYIFWSIAIICEDYLVLAVVFICDRANVPYDIGGAVFLAGATATPEFSIALIGVFVTETELGISTIIGSAVINILVVTGLCGVCADTPLVLGWWSVSRENFWYILSIIMVYLILLDQRVTIEESASMIGVFIANVVFLLIDRPIQSCLKITTVEEETVAEEEADGPISCSDRLCDYPNDASSCIKFFWFLKKPIDVLFAITIPKAHAFPTESLIVCIVWVGLQCYLTAWLISIIGYNFAIPDGVMGVTFVALGVSVPDAVASYIVSRKGHGAMAVSNAISSNTFDNLLGLGAPWTGYILYHGHDLLLKDAFLPYITLILIVTTVIMQLAFILTRYRLGRVFGCICFVTYGIFIIVCIAMYIIICYK